MFDENSNKIKIERIKIPKKVILCDYVCNRNMILQDFFYLIIQKYQVQGTTCKTCKKDIYEHLSVRTFKEAHFRCPRCKKNIFSDPVASQRDKKTPICMHCWISEKTFKKNIDDNLALSPKDKEYFRKKESRWLNRPK